jgi:Putative Flp pilus-assembly TadE/G-like
VERNDGDSIDKDSAGQALPFVVVSVCVAAVCALALGRLGVREVARARAQTSADAAALAGVRGGYDAAERLVHANCGELLAFTATRAEVVVRVSCDGVTATAHATLIEV